MKKIFILSLFITSCAFSNSQIDQKPISSTENQFENQTQFNDNLNKLVNLMFDKNHFVKLCEVAIDEIFKLYPIKATRQEITDDLMQKFNSANVADSFKSLWKKHYDAKEIEELLKFYESPVGKKSLRIMPELMQESSQIGGKIGQEIIIKYVPACDPVQTVDYKDQSEN